MPQQISLNTLEAKGIALNALVKELEETFPPHTPQPGDPYEYIMYRAGQFSVIEFILRKMEE